MVLKFSKRKSAKKNTKLDINGTMRVLNLTLGIVLTSKFTTSNETVLPITPSLTAALRLRALWIQTSCVYTLAPYGF